VHRLFIDLKNSCGSVRWEVLRNIFIEFDVHHETGKANNTYERNL